MNKEEINSPDRKFWKSLKEYEDDPSIQEIKHNEFLKGVTDDFDIDELPDKSRRRFLAILGASAAVAATACSEYNDKGSIVPYNRKPEEVTPGVPNYYASTCNMCPSACGVLVKTREGRPIKVDGNPEHPVNQGKICTTGQASIYNLYDPERIQNPLRNKNGKLGTFEWLRADREIIKGLEAAKAANKEIAILTQTITSPAFNRLLSDFTAKYPTTKIYPYEVFDDTNPAAAWQAIYGSQVMPKIKWNKAKVILALESDFLSREGNSVENQRLFAEGRDINNIDKFARLYSAEGGMSVTGMNADYRFRVNPARQMDFIMALISELMKRSQAGSANIPQELRNQAANYSLDKFARDNNLNQAKLNTLINDLANNPGSAIVYAGKSLPVQVQAAAAFLNEAIGGTALYDYAASDVVYIAPAQRQQIEELVGKMKAGNVGVIIHIEINPAFNLPADYGYSDAIKKVPLVISLTDMQDETAQLAHYVLPVNHYMESWGDHRTRAGIYSLRQPVIKSLYYSRQAEAVLLNWLSGTPENYKEDIYHQYLMAFWEREIYPLISPATDFRTFWFAALHDGVVRSNEAVPEAPSAGNFSNILSGYKSPNITDGYTVILEPSYALKDGRYANNGWLQELPHPVSKVVWDNYAAVSYKDADRLGVKDGSLIEVNINGRKQQLPVIVQPGVADRVITIELGYGRTHAGTVGSGIGTNANVLLSRQGGFSPWIYTGAQVTKASGSYPLATTQEHHTMNDEFIKDQHKKRDIVKVASILSYKKNPKLLRDPKHVPLNIHHDHEYKEVKWGMAIDMNKCIGCGECVVACMVENNVPVVGKEQVMKGREMQWLRIDRYYSGAPEDPEVTMQAMLCQHCDNAPCEPVCPVTATTHSIDGLNQMVYNRCVGTRYCSNNCPYKVRRFNYFDFRDHLHDGFYKQDSVKLANNPEVTVRSRGVMEKCTFCIQRVMSAREEAVREGRKVKGSDVQTACQQACPTNAITFGDLNDPNSEVSKLRDHNLGYHVFYEMNFRPNVTYIAKLKNTNSEEA